MTSDDAVLNAREAAAFLKAHVETVRRLARRGEIPSFKLGKDWRFSKDALQRWSEGQQRQHSHGNLGFVLIVDDDTKVCRTLSRMLERIGCSTRYATDGAEGLELVAREAPDLILLDLKMPDMNGPQFLEKLRQTHPDLPVVIVTGYPDSELMAQAAQYGPLMLLAKPVEPTQIERTIRLVLGEKAIESFSKGESP